MKQQCDKPHADAIPMQRGWIEAAKCPNCGGEGYIAHQVAAGEWEQEQCQWCDERHQALHEKPSTPSHEQEKFNAGFIEGFTGNYATPPAGVAEEKCTYCGESYPQPVSYHHSNEECVDNQVARDRGASVPSTIPRSDALAAFGRIFSKAMLFNRGSVEEYKSDHDAVVSALSATPRSKREQAAADILLALVTLKRYKDFIGKDAHYDKAQTEAWKLANDYLQVAMPAEYAVLDQGIEALRRPDGGKETNG